MLEPIVLGSILGYVFLGGVAWAVADVCYGFNSEDRGFSAAFWPIALVVWFVYQVATAGPRLIAWGRRPKLPKATASTRNKV